MGHPVCGMRADGRQSPEHSLCTREARVTGARVTDHIMPHKGDVTLFWAGANHQSLCLACHNRKTATETGAFRLVP